MSFHHVNIITSILILILITGILSFSVFVNHSYLLDTNGVSTSASLTHVRFFPLPAAAPLPPAAADDAANLPLWNPLPRPLINPLPLPEYPINDCATLPPAAVVVDGTSATDDSVALGGFVDATSVDSVLLLLATETADSATSLVGVGLEVSTGNASFAVACASVRSLPPLPAYDLPPKYPRPKFPCRPPLPPLGGGLPLQSVNVQWMKSK